MTCSRPAISAPRWGAAPVAIRMFSARTLSPLPTSRTVCGVLDHCAALDDRNLGPLERAGVGGFEPRNLPILVGDQLPPVEHRLVDGPAVARRVLELVGKTRGIDQQFLGNAAADHAGAADPEFLRHHDARAVAGSNPRRPHAARAGTDDEQIDVVISTISCPFFFISARILRMISSDSLFAHVCEFFRL